MVQARLQSYAHDLGTTRHLFFKNTTLLQSMRQVLVKPIPRHHYLDPHCLATWIVRIRGQLSYVSSLLHPCQHWASMLMLSWPWLRLGRLPVAEGFSSFLAQVHFVVLQPQYSPLPRIRRVLEHRGHIFAHLPLSAGVRLVVVPATFVAAAGAASPAPASAAFV